MATDAPRIAWLLNLDADRELQDPQRYRAVELRSVRPDWRERMADLVGSSDVVLPSSEARPGEHVVQCFCPTTRALEQLEASGFTPPEAPPMAVLRAVNDRAFCAQLGQCLPGSSFVHDMDSLEQQLAIASPSGRYVIKRAFSFAGREQRRVHNGVLDASTRGFCERSFASGEGVQIEPWLERLADFSRHGYLTRAGVLTIAAAREQRCDEHGRFLGVALDAPNILQAEADQLAAELQRVAAALTAQGYFGPFGIDGFRYRLPDGAIGFNPRCEINARFTMGYPRALLLNALSAG